MIDWNSVSADLTKKLDPKHIKPAPRGKFGDYIEGHHAISEANRIFGHGGWSYELTRLELVSRQVVTVNGKDQLRVGYLASVRVTVDGKVREGCAVGSGLGNPDNEADHHESAVKEAETDALKRALRTFGNPFGLALYDKTKADVGVNEPTAEEKEAAERKRQEEVRDWLKGAMSKKTTQKQLHDFRANEKNAKAWEALPAPMQNELNTAYNDAWNRLPDDPALQGRDAA